MADSLYTRLGDEKIPCRVCGKPIWGITQHRKDKHPEVSKRAWSKLGDWKGPPTPGQPPLVQEGAPGETDAERAAWLADKIAAHGDYAKEAAAMLRRWPAAPVVQEGEAANVLAEAALVRIGYLRGDNPTRRDEALLEVAGYIQRLERLAQLAAPTPAVPPGARRMAGEARAGQQGGGEMECATCANHDLCRKHGCAAKALERERNAGVAPSDGGQHGNLA